jgi:hypothetical protein
VPREIALEVGGISDLNRTEDIEFCARLSKKCIVLPVLRGFDFMSDEEFMKSLDMHSHYVKNTLITTYVSERRYAKNFLNYIRREFRNKIDMIHGMGYGHPETIIRECVFLRKFKGFKMLLCIIYHLFLLILTRVLKKSIYTHDYIINNGSLCDIVMTFNYLALISYVVRGHINVSSKAYEEVLLNIKRLVKANSSILSYYLAHRPETVQLALSGKFFIDLVD